MEMNSRRWYVTMKLRWCVGVQAQQLSRQARVRGCVVGKDDEYASGKGGETIWKEHASTGQCVRETPNAKMQEG